MANFLADVMLGMDSYKNLLKDIGEKKDVVGINGVIEEALGHFIYSVSHHEKGSKFIVTYDDSRARMIFEDLKNLGLKNVYLFPKREEFFYSTLAKSLDNSNKQVEALWSILNEESIVVTTVDATLIKVMNKELFDLRTMKLTMVDKIELEELSSFLLDGGYERVNFVEGRGQFSPRGGIVDIFSPIHENPYRIELFDNEIDSIRTFDLRTQRSLETVDEIMISPARENMILDEDRKIIAEELRKDLSSTKIKDKLILENLEEKFSGLLEKLDENFYISDLDLLLPYIPKENLSSIVDYIPKNALVFIDEPRRIEERIKSLEDELRMRLSDLLLAGEVLYSHEKIIYGYEDIVSKLNDYIKITFSNVLRDNKYYKPKSILSFQMKSATSFNGRMDIFKEEIENYQYRGYKIAILSDGNDRLKRLNKNLKDLGINAQIAENLDRELKSNQIFLYDASLKNGFEYTSIKFSIINHREIYGNITKKKTKRKKPAGLTDFADISIGDYVVHENHGLGIYQGTEQVEIQGVKRDYILIQYAGADKLYIPTDQLGLIHKFVGNAVDKPRINKLNSVEWSRTKSKAKKSIDDMADELIELYAAREAKKGYAFSADTDWQGQFEDLFPYQETEGQAISSEEIKKDMEEPRPMDRLLCADVGYGKTEVALRAAFKAVMDGKQVAILVPTTILAQQHYNTIIERFREFPITTAVLSRFRTRKEINEDIKNIRKGMIDIVVGTHRLLSKDVVFKDLGLLIIDEEQRFGVKHKETLKKIKENVDTLTLTATPIPRTLQMSMIGIRDMSVIEEPPEERFPIQTYVTEFNRGMVKEAITRELNRGGQVYFLYNRIEGISQMAMEISELVPEARVATAHGRMSELELENTMLSFLQKESDILVCTTIIETGLDIPNVNTIIVFDADKLGLSQLYQLRGRVGRSNRIAYGYFTYQKDKQLSEISEKRLMAIKEFTEFGSGFKIAMRDLEIRGAGNILGSRQHGHIDAIGYDLYLSYLETAIKKLKGEEVREINDTSMEINVEAFIPKDYVEDEHQRLELYKKISIIENDEDYHDLMDEVIDRYGDAPESLNNLMDISFIKQQANSKDIISIRGDKDSIRINFKDESKPDVMKLNNLIPKYGRDFKLQLTGEKFIEFKPIKYPLLELKDIITAI